MIFRQPKVVIYVTKQKIVMGLWHGSRYQSHRTYENQASGHVAFRQYIADHQYATIHLIVDVVEEEYQLEVLPHATGAARHEMRSRKLTQFRRNSLYKTAWFLGQKKAIRKEDSYVLLALTNTVALQQWLDVLQSEEALLVGITPLPIVSQDMLRSVKSASSKLLVCERLSAGLRLSYLEQSHLRISRLIPIEDVPLVDFYLAEIEKMRLYLLSQKTISDGSSLHVILSGLEVASDGVSAGLAQHGLECQVLNRQHDIRKHYLRQVDVEAHPELLHMQWLASGSKLENLAPVAITKNYRLHRLSKRLAVGMSLLIVTGLLTSGYLLYQGYVKNVQITPLLEQADALSKKQAFIVKSHPETPMQSRDLKNAVMIAEAVNQTPALPVTLMQTVSAALKNESAIVINRLRCLQSEHLHISGEESGEPVGSPKQADSGKWLKIGFVDAEIQPFTGDYPMALATVNRFANKLRAATSVASVKLLQIPVNVVSSSVLRGNTREQKLVPTSATFKLKIIFKSVEKEGRA